MNWITICLLNICMLRCNCVHISMLTLAFSSKQYCAWKQTHRAAARLHTHILSLISSLLSGFLSPFHAVLTCSFVFDLYSVLSVLQLYFHDTTIAPLTLSAMIFSLLFLLFVTLFNLQKLKQRVYPQLQLQDNFISCGPSCTVFSFSSCLPLVFSTSLVSFFLSSLSSLSYAIHTHLSLRESHGNV